MTRIGYQIPSFTYPDVGPAELFEAVAVQAEAADRSGFDTVLVMDHFYQLPMLGEPEDYMLECYTLLGALAGRTQNVRLSSLVTGNTYRNPALLAKIIATLDVVSGGRAQLGIGAGWFEEEHASLGFEFGTFTDRFERLEEALQIIGPMLAGDRPTLDGERYSVSEAICEPPPVGRVPILIGGSGEKKTLRMVAQYADESNLTCGPDEVARKLEALDAHCARLERDRSEITVSLQTQVCVALGHDEADRAMRGFLERRGMDLDSMDEETRSMILAMVVVGDPDEVGEQLQARMDLGVDGLTMNLVANGHHPENVELLGQVASRVIGSPPAS